MDKVGIKNLSHMLAKSGHGFERAAISQQEAEQKKADGYNASAGHLNDADGYDCPQCKNKGYIASVQYNDFGGYWSETLAPCKCQRVRAAIRRLNRSGLGSVVKKYTFELYEAPNTWQQRLKYIAQQYSTNARREWFFIGGQSGAGKTHLCTAIAIQLLRQGSAVRYMLWRDEITRIKAIVNDAIAYEAAMKELKSTEVLYIDDLFKCGKDEQGNPKPPTAADINVAFEIINHRYNANLTTIISSERSIGELRDIDEAIAGRIAEKARADGCCISIRHDPGKNYRLSGMTEL